MNHKFVIQSATNRARLYDDPSLSHHKPSRDKYIHEDSNLLAVIAAYLNGDGATELRRTAAALNIGNFKSIKKMHHKTSKYCLGNIIVKEARKVADECLIEEVRTSYMEKHPHFGDEEWMNFHNALLLQPPQQESTTTHNAQTVDPVDLIVSADMGWQKRSSGRKYDSPSGHMFLVGSSTNNIIDYEIKCVSCAICNSAKRRGQDPRPHHCQKNFDGHAKAMEATSAAELITRISNKFHGKARVSTVISDDDSSMRAHCSHKGGLPQNVLEPIFLSDPSHRCKVIGKPLFKLAALKKSSCTLTTHDATRIKVYCACFFNMNKNKNRTLAWMKDHAWCVLYHYFNDHRYCTADFCYKKREAATRAHAVSTGGSSNNPQSPAENPPPDPTLSRLHALRSSPGYYRCMSKDKKLFDQLKQSLEPFFSEESIKDVMHCHNTQTNEGLNTAMLVTAPKFKNYSRSLELAIRVALVVGCHNIGKRKFIERVLEQLNVIKKTTAFLDLLELEDTSKKKRQLRQSTVRAKRRRITKRVSRALEARRKNIQAIQRGTTYGENTGPSKRKLKPSTCPFKDYGCNTPGHTHKSILSSECKYHYLWKHNRDSEKPQRVSQEEWKSRVKAIWELENTEAMERNAIGIQDVMDNEFSGDMSLLSSANQESAHPSTESHHNAASPNSSFQNIVTQEGSIELSQDISCVDMCDMEFVTDPKDETSDSSATDNGYNQDINVESESDSDSDSEDHLQSTESSQDDHNSVISVECNDESSNKEPESLWL